MPWSHWQGPVIGWTFYSLNGSVIPGYPQKQRATPCSGSPIPTLSRASWGHRRCPARRAAPLPLASSPPLAVPIGQRCSGAEPRLAARSATPICHCWYRPPRRSGAIGRCGDVSAGRRRHWRAGCDAGCGARCSGPGARPPGAAPAWGESGGSRAHGPRGERDWGQPGGPSAASCPQPCPQPCPGAPGALRPGLDSSVPERRGVPGAGLSGDKEGREGTGASLRSKSWGSWVCSAPRRDSWEEASLISINICGRVLRGWSSLLNSKTRGDGQKVKRRNLHLSWGRTPLVCGWPCPGTGGEEPPRGIPQSCLQSCAVCSGMTPMELGGHQVSPVVPSSPAHPGAPWSRGSGQGRCCFGGASGWNPVSEPLERCGEEAQS